MNFLTLKMLDNSEKMLNFVFITVALLIIVSLLFSDYKDRNFLLRHCYFYPIILGWKTLIKITHHEQYCYSCNYLVFIIS